MVVKVIAMAVVPCLWSKLFTTLILFIIAFTHTPKDAVVLVIHRILFGILQTKQTFGPSLVLLGLAKFLIVSTGSLLIGVSYGVASALLTLATRHVEGCIEQTISFSVNPLSPSDVEPVLLLLLAYTSYVSAEIFEWSGVVSIIGCGLVSGAVTDTWSGLCVTSVAMMEC